MKLTKKENFIINMWKETSRYDPFNFEKKYNSKAVKSVLNTVNNKIMKRKCCSDRINKDFIYNELKQGSIKFSTSDRCMLSFSTHMMHRIYHHCTQHMTDSKFDSNKKMNKIRVYTKMVESRPDPRDEEEENSKNEKLYINFANNSNCQLNCYGYDQFYFFNKQLNDECLCDRDASFKKGEIDCLKKRTYYLEPPMCTRFLEPYMISKSTLNDMNLTNLLVKMLLPYTYILPVVFSGITEILLTKSMYVLEKREMFEKKMEFDLCNELISLRNEYVTSYDKSKKAVNSFFISGGLVPYLLNQTISFGEVDIYINLIDLKKFGFRNYFNKTDSGNNKIWIEDHKKTSWLGEILFAAFYMNKKSYIYKLLKKFLGGDFHPPQIILYKQNLWNKNSNLNKVAIKSHCFTDYFFTNLDSLITDAYNVISEFDIPFCRNAIVFLNKDKYYPVHDKFSEHTQNIFDRTNIEYDVFDQFYRHHIKINIDDLTADEISNLQFFYSKDNPYKNSLYYVAGLSYQTGGYKFKPNPRGPLNDDGEDSEIIKFKIKYILRQKKYLARCKLNNNIDLNSNPKEAKLNYLVPRLDHLSYNVTQKNNKNVFLYCFCKVGKYGFNYESFHKSVTDEFNFLNAISFHPNI